MHAKVCPLAPPSPLSSIASANGFTTLPKSCLSDCKYQFAVKKDFGIRAIFGRSVWARDAPSSALEIVDSVLVVIQVVLAG